MPCERSADLLAGLGIKQETGLVPASSGNQLRVGAESNSEHLLCVPSGLLVTKKLEEGTWRLWEVQTGNWRPLPQLDGTRGIALSPDSLLLAAGKGPQIGLWSVSTPQAAAMTIQAHTSEYVRCVSFSPDGSLLLSCSDTDTTCPLWEVKTGRKVGSLKGHTGGVEEVAFLAHSSLLAASLACYMDPTCRLWDVATRACLHIIPWPIYFTAIASCPLSLSPSPSAGLGGGDQQRCLFALGDSQGTISVWSLTSPHLKEGKESHEGSRHELRLLSLPPQPTLLLSAHGALLAAAEMDASARALLAQCGADVTAVVDISAPGAFPLLSCSLLL